SAIPPCSGISQGLCSDIYLKARNKEHLNLFEDVFFSPLSIKKLCDVIKVCIIKQIKGTFNVGSHGVMSKKEFLICFLQNTGIEGFEYSSVLLSDLNLKVSRPYNMSMKLDKFEKAYKFNLPNLKEEIEDVANEFK
ncbi:sugar nucleotide-binding protein, partial [Vibrio sp. 10N.286.52.C3]|uniref:sugar nucleotide-binding protein n=1 Tax=Vibrio sp. 10N.286.52.C3 TaxID=3229713 RepID=UPI0035530663